MWKTTHSESGQWLSYQDSDNKFYTRETHDDKEWKILKRTNGVTQLTCVDTTTEYQPTKYSIPVRIHTTAGGKIYEELGAELETTTNRLQQNLGMWKGTHSESSQWLSYQDNNKKFYA